MSMALEIVGWRVSHSSATQKFGKAFGKKKKKPAGCHSHIWLFLSFQNLTLLSRWPYLSVSISSIAPNIVPDKRMSKTVITSNYPCRWYSWSSNDDICVCFHIHQNNYQIFKWGEHNAIPLPFYKLLKSIWLTKPVTYSDWNTWRHSHQMHPINHSSGT